jgi:hypothetical protein
MLIFAKKYKVKFLKNIAVLIVLVAFLVPASGIMVFLHHCSAMGTTELSVDGSNSCCSVPVNLFMAVEHNECAISHEGNCTHHTFFSKQACCEDSRLFVKIDANYLSSSFKVLQPDVAILAFFNSVESSAVLLAGTLSGILIDSPDPPWSDILLVTSSLRL